MEQFLKDVLRGEYDAGTYNCANSDPREVAARLREVLLNEGWTPPAKDERNTSEPAE